MERGSVFPLIEEEDCVMRAAMVLKLDQLLSKSPEPVIVFVSGIRNETKNHLIRCIIMYLEWLCDITSNDNRVMKARIAEAIVIWSGFIAPFRMKLGSSETYQTPVWIMDISSKDHASNITGILMSNRKFKSGSDLMSTITDSASLAHNTSRGMAVSSGEEKEVLLVRDFRSKPSFPFAKDVMGMKSRAIFVIPAEHVRECLPSLTYLIFGNICANNTGCLLEKYRKSYDILVHHDEDTVFTEVKQQFITSFKNSLCTMDSNKLTVSKLTGSIERLNCAIIEHMKTFPAPAGVKLRRMSMMSMFSKSLIEKISHQQSNSSITDQITSLIEQRDVVIIHQCLHQYLRTMLAEVMKAFSESHPVSLLRLHEWCEKTILTTLSDVKFAKVISSSFDVSGIGELFNEYLVQQSVNEPVMSPLLQRISHEMKKRFAFLSEDMAETIIERCVSHYKNHVVLSDNYDKFMESHQKTMDEAYAILDKHYLITAGNKECKRKLSTRLLKISDELLDKMRDTGLH